MREKGMWIAVGILMLLMPIISALSTNMKPEYMPGETMIVKVSGNLLMPILNGQVKILRAGHIEVPSFTPQVVKMGEETYIWAQAPRDVKQNYTLEISGVQTTVNGQQQILDFRQNFSVGGNKSAAYSIRPGAILTKKDFDITVTLYEDEPHIISVDFPAVRDISLKPGVNVVTFSTAGIRGIHLYIVRMGIYSIPVYFIGNTTTTIEPSPYVHINPERIRRVHPAGETKIVYRMIIDNTGDKDVENVTFSYNKDLFSIQPDIVRIQKNKEASFNITLNKHTAEAINEMIYVRSSNANFSMELPVEIKFIENRTNISINNGTNGSTAIYYCFELGGSVCSSNEYCDKGTEQISLDGMCCVKGTCSVAKEDGGNYRWIGWLIGSLAVLGLGYLFFRYKKTSRTKNPMEKEFAEAEEKIQRPSLKLKSKSLP